VQPRCRAERPALFEMGESHEAACWNPVPGTASP
jgi:hypothetical protein